MKNPIPTPVVIGVVAVVLVLVVAFFVKGATAEPRTPRPDRAKMMGGSTPAPSTTSSQ